MKKGEIYIYAGYRSGKSFTALGTAIKAAASGEQVVIIQFLQGEGLADTEFIRRMEPELKLFKFEKDVPNIRNGLGFANKLLTTNGCSLLILDEVLGLVEKGIITNEELENLLETRGETTVVLTGETMENELFSCIDTVHIQCYIKS